MSHTAPTLAVLGCLLAACAETPSAPEYPFALQAAKGSPRSSGGESAVVADAAPGDFAHDPADASLLHSTCPGKVGTQWSVNYEHTGCLIVRPAWTSSAFAAYELTDDVRLIATKEKGRNGRITHITLLAQDVIGDAGVAHETDAIAVAVPVTPSKTGFIVHVHAAGIPVWRLSGHTGGERVEVIGTIAIGDIVYR